MNEQTPIPNLPQPTTDLEYIERSVVDFGNILKMNQVNFKQIKEDIKELDEILTTVKSENIKRILANTRNSWKAQHTQFGNTIKQIRNELKFCMSIRKTVIEAMK